MVPAPPLPRTSVFAPSTSKGDSMARKPRQSVLSPYQPFARRTMVLTLPSRRARSESSAQRGMTAFL